MNKNTYPGLALAICIGFVSAPLLAEVSPAPEYPAQTDEQIPTFKEHQEPSELQRQQAEHKRANMKAPAASVKVPLEPKEALEPSELQHEQIEHNNNTGN
jgi:hypothetical protein